MSGIVEQLRVSTWTGSRRAATAYKAANTIEDLLAALERARGSVKCAISHQDVGTMGRRTDESVLAQIDAAMAKAKGGGA
jgi:hypothetical protein